MALSYVLEIETNLQPHLLSNMIETEFSIEQKALSIIIEEIEKRDIDVTESLFNFRPNLAIILRINSQSSNNYNLKLIAQITLFVLQKIRGNAVLLFNEEIMIIQRINEQLIFNEYEWKMLSGVDISSIMLKAIA